MDQKDDSTFEREREIFFAALDKVTEESRAQFLEEACDGDTEMLGRVQKMLEHHSSDESETFLAPQIDLEAAVPHPVFEHEPGTRIGNFKLIEKIGEGGFGVVYLAEQQEPVQRKVALKLIKPGMDSAEVIARFNAERQALAVMDHPHIAKVFDAGATDTGRPYFVMELATGAPITNYCDAHKLDTKARLELFAKVCRAVQHAHQKAIIHRDLKPSNILVVESEDEDGVMPKIIDFGIAKAIAQEPGEKTAFTAQGQLVGTPQYMSPEQAQIGGSAAADIDTRSDVYSLGIVLYELLAGSPPFDVETLRSAGFEGMCKIIREQDPPKPSNKLSTSTRRDSTKIAQSRDTQPQQLERQVRGELDWIVMRAIEKDRARRYESPNALAEDIARHLRDEPISAGPPSASYKFGKFVQRNKARLLAGGLATAALIVGLLVAGWVWLDAEWQERERIASVENHAITLLNEGERQLQLNEDAPFDNAAHFLQAKELANRLNELVGIDQTDGELQARVDDFENAVTKEDKLRKLIHEAEEARIFAISSLSGSSKRREYDRLKNAFDDYWSQLTEAGAPEITAWLEGIRPSARIEVISTLLRWTESSDEITPERIDEILAGILAIDLHPQIKELITATQSEDLELLKKLAHSIETQSIPITTATSFSSTLLDLGDPASSELLLRKLHDTHPEEFWPNYALGIVLMKNEISPNAKGKTFNYYPGQSFEPQAFSECIGYLRAALAARPDSGEAWTALAQALAFSGEFDVAESYCLRTLAAGHSGAHSTLGIIFFTQKRSPRPYYTFDRPSILTLTIHWRTPILEGHCSSWAILMRPSPNAAGHQNRPEQCSGKLQPWICSWRTGQDRRGHCPLPVGHRNRPELRVGSQQPWINSRRTGQVRRGLRPLATRHRNRPGQREASQHPRSGTCKTRQVRSGHCPLATRHRNRHGQRRGPQQPWKGTCKTRQFR